MNYYCYDLKQWFSNFLSIFAFLFQDLIDSNLNKNEIYQKYLMKIISTICTGKGYLVRRMCLSYMTQTVNS